MKANILHIKPKHFKKKEKKRDAYVATSFVKTPWKAPKIPVDEQANASP